MVNVEKLLSLLFYLDDLMKADSPDPVLAALKRAERGAILGIIGALILMVLIQLFIPEQAELSAGTTLALARLVQYWFCWFLASMVLLSALFGLHQVIRYVLVLKWPERFVNFDQ